MFSEAELAEAESLIMSDYPYIYNRLSGQPAKERDDEFAAKFDVAARMLSFKTSMGDRIWLQGALLDRCQGKRGWWERALDRLRRFSF